VKTLANCPSASDARAFGVVMGVMRDFSLTKGDLGRQTRGLKGQLGKKNRRQNRKPTT
jgi:hypothetical protein